jgi:hypothetical protein
MFAVAGKLLSTKHPYFQGLPLIKLPKFNMVTHKASSRFSCGSISRWSMSGVLLSPSQHSMLNTMSRRINIPMVKLICREVNSQGYYELAFIAYGPECWASIGGFYATTGNYGMQRPVNLYGSAATGDFPFTAPDTCTTASGYTGGVPPSDYTGLEIVYGSNYLSNTVPFSGQPLPTGFCLNSQVFRTLCRNLLDSSFSYNPVLD